MMWTFIKSAAYAKDYPQWPLPYPHEIAFVGRSNVGKSSLINALTKQRALARVSNTPGRTQLVNFFRDRTHVLVDLPGYGYARLSKTKRLAVSEVVKTYVKTSQHLKHVFVLIDARRGVLDIDETFINDLLAPAGVSWSLVFTKSDKLNQKLRVQAERQASVFAVPYLFVASYTNLNIDTLRHALFEI